PLRIVGEDPAGDPRAFELSGHPFFLGTAFQPERAALAGDVHPIVLGFLRAAREARLRPPVAQGARQPWEQEAAMPTIEVQRDGAVARLWLNRPEQHNALAPEMTTEMTAALHELAHDAAVRVVVLGGRGPSFCAGADIAALKASGTRSFEQNLAEAE